MNLEPDPDQGGGNALRTLVLRLWVAPTKEPVLPVGTEVTRP